MLRELDCPANQCARETSSVTMTNTTAPRRIRRLAERQTTDRDALFALLDEELVGHLAAVVDGSPVVVPMGFARDGEHLLVHGSTGGGFALRAAAERATVAFSVTAVDGLVYARSLFDSSMNYRSAVATACSSPSTTSERMPRCSRSPSGSCPAAPPRCARSRARRPPRPACCGWRSTTS